MAGGVAEFVDKMKAMGKSALDNSKAGLDVAGSALKTIGKRAIGDDSPTELKPETKKFLNISSPSKGK